MIGAIGDSTRQLIAERIKTGGVLDAEIGRGLDRPPIPSPPDKDRAR